MADLTYEESKARRDAPESWNFEFMLYITSDAGVARRFMSQKVA